MATQDQGRSQNIESPFSTLPEVVYYQDTQTSSLPDNANDYHTHQLPVHATAIQDRVRRRQLYLWIAVSAFLIVGVVVGSVVGVVVKKHIDRPAAVSTVSLPGTSTATYLGTPTTFPPSTATSSSVCRGTVCPSMLAAVTYSSAPTTFIFVLGTDSAIWYRQGDGVAWSTEWTSLGGTFLSQPAAVLLENGRVDVFAVWKDQSMRTKSFQNGSWNSWINLGGYCVTPPSVCSWGVGKWSVFVLSRDRALYHKWYDGGWLPSQTGDWEYLNGWVSSSPVCACGGNNTVGVALYGGVSGLTPNDPYPIYYKRYNDMTWSNWEGGQGNFRGDPTAVALGPERTDYFGIGSDKAMYHQTWLLTSGYSSVESLGGGPFESTPFVLATSTYRIDVLSVGSDGRLKHKALIGSSWSRDWEDLGGSFIGAPVAVSTDSGQISVFGIGPNGTVIHGTFNGTDEFSWGGGAWFLDGGSVSTNWFRFGPA